MMSVPFLPRPFLGFAVALALAGCAVTAPVPHVDASAPAAWHPLLPHHGRVEDIARWWDRLGDPVLVDLIAAAQEIAPGVAQARSHVQQARARQVAARSLLQPAFDVQGGGSRGISQPVAGLATLMQGTVQASWEVDIFGGNAAAAEAARERLAGAQAQWHEARVSVAAEVATQYDGWRQCLRLAEVAESDASSRAESARLSEASERAGFTAPAMRSLAQASNAEGRMRAKQQHMACEIGLKGLVALSGLPEADLRARATASSSALELDALFTVHTLPAQVLAQRPDLYTAEREVAAASADVGNARAQRLPRLTLAGFIGRARDRMGGTSLAADTWSIGPVGVSLPIFDAGRRAAQVDAAEARYHEAAWLYRANVRRAVSEVEQALVRLASTAARRADAERAAEGYRVSFVATEALWRGGLASLVELEDTRRAALNAETALIALRQERMAAWIDLYRAAGGGWEPPKQSAAVP